MIHQKIYRGGYITTANRIVKRFKCNFIKVFDYIVNPDCTDSSDAPSPDVPVPTLVTRCPSTVPEAYLMQSL